MADDTADARKVAEEIRSLWRDYRGGAVSDDQRTQETAIRLLAYAERVREEQDDHWIAEAREGFEGVRGREEMESAGFTDLACFVLHEVWKRDPKVAALLARAEAAEAKLQEAEEHNRLTDSMLACGPPNNPAAGNCGWTCRACVLKRLQEAEAKLRGMIEELIDAHAAGLELTAKLKKAHEQGIIRTSQLQEAEAERDRLNEKLVTSYGLGITLTAQVERLTARLSESQQRVEELEGHVCRLLGDLSDAERAVQGWRFQGGMGENIAQEDRGRFPTIATSAHRRDAEASLARPEAPTPEMEEAWPTSGDKATQEWRRIREERHGEPEMEP